MKIFFLLLAFVMAQASFSQTFQSGFDNLDRIGGGAGQNQSFYSNVISGLHNVESQALQGYINMFKATLDKKYIDQFIIHAKRVQERRDDNIQNIPNEVAGFTPNAVLTNDNCSCTKPLSSLISQIDHNSKGWSFVENPCNCVYVNPAVVHSGEITYPMAQFVWFMQSDADFITLANEIVPLEVQTVPSCNGTTHIDTYSDFAAWLKCRIAETITYHEPEWQYDSDNDITRYINENLNGQCSLGRTIALMYKITGSSFYHQRTTDIALLIHSRLEEYTVTVNGNSEPYYTWNYSWGTGCREDIGHAYLTMEFAEICSRFGIINSDQTQGLLFNNPNMLRFANTFAYKMYKEPLSFWQSTSGDNNVCYEGGPAHYAWLAKYNPYIFQIMSDGLSEDAIYNDAGHLKTLSHLALLQSRNNIPNTLNNQNFKFNPMAVRRGHSPGSNVYYLASGDFDKNGMKDFVSMDFSNGIFYTNTPDICVNPNLFPANCWVVANSGSHTPYDAWKGIAGGDFDYDGNPANHQGDEVIALNNTQGKIYLLKQNGTTFNEESISSSVTWAGLTAGDFDSNNPGDEAIGVVNNGDVYMITYNGSIQISNTPIANLGISNAVGVTSGNFDGTNIPQIAVVDNTPGNITIFKYQNGTFTQTYQNTDAGCCNAWNGITAGSFDGDGVDDIAVHRDADGVIRILKVKGGSLQSVYDEFFPIFPVNQSIRAMGTGKFKLSTDKDGLIVFRNFDGQITIFNMDGQCPNTYVNNTTIDENYSINNTYTNTNNNYVIDYHANNTLYASNFKMGDISGTDNSEVNFIAGNKIVVTAGANGSAAYSGSKFHAYIDAQNLACSQPYLRTQNNPPHKPTSSTPVVFNNESQKAKPSTYINANVSPNPNNGKFTLQIKDTEGESSEIFVYNSLGEMVYHSATANLQSQIDLSSQPKGIYFIKIQNRNNIFADKIIIQ